MGSWVAYSTMLNLRGEACYAPTISLGRSAFSLACRHFRHKPTKDLRLGQSILERVVRQRRDPR